MKTIGDAKIGAAQFIKAVCESLSGVVPYSHPWQEAAFFLPSENVEKVPWGGGGETVCSG